MGQKWVKNGSFWPFWGHFGTLFSRPPHPVISIPYSTVGSFENLEKREKRVIFWPFLQKWSFLKKTIFFRMNSPWTSDDLSVLPKSEFTGFRHEMTIF